MAQGGAGVSCLELPLRKSQNLGVSSQRSQGNPVTCWTHHTIPMGPQVGNVGSHFREERRQELREGKGQRAGDQGRSSCPMGKLTPSNTSIPSELSPGPRTATSLPPHLLKMSQASSIFPPTPRQRQLSEPVTLSESLAFSGFTSLLH